MKKALRLSALAIAAATTTGLIGFTAPALADGGDVYKREDDSGRIVTTVDSDDDDDLGTNARDDASRADRDTGRDTNTRGTRSDGTGDSRSRADNTNSRVSAVSRDRDKSRGDRTRDWTRDGGTLTRDRSANQTNDRSRNDTRR